MSKGDLEELTGVCTQVSEAANSLVDALTRKANSSGDASQVDTIIRGVNSLTGRVGDLVQSFVAFLKDNSSDAGHRSLVSSAHQLASAVSPLLSGMGDQVARDVRLATQRMEREVSELRSQATVSPDALLASAKRVVSSVSDVGAAVAVAQRAAESPETRESLTRHLQDLKGHSTNVIRAAQAMVRSPSDESLPRAYDDAAAALSSNLRAIEAACDAEVSSSQARVAAIQAKIDTLLGN
eukprot:TRINITY_DN2576_c0_g1_i1.p1 TRINITY_DN2576_c0_g1~~TRINITY_DN2576_c0_g1_i1.p1  ORF type:complete len:259 (+),score=-28.61 TRINITY_DN2576_c0_g1_i1:61-777(+)